VAFLPDGRGVVALGSSNVIQVVEAGTGECLAPGAVLDAPLLRAAFSPDGKTVAADDGKKVYRWEAATGKPLGKPLVAAEGEEVAELAFGLDGRTLLIGGADRLVRIHDVATGLRVGQPILYPGMISSVALSADGKNLLVGGGNNRAWLYQLPGRRPAGPTLRHTQPCWDLAWGPDGALLATGTGEAGKPGQAHLWEVSTGRPLRPPLPHPAKVGFVAFSPDGKTLLAGEEDGTVRFWEVATGKSPLEPIRHGARLDCLACSPDGKTLLSGGGGVYRLWNAPTRTSTLPPWCIRGGSIAAPSARTDGPS
jgi:WD40 repeat protein